MKIIDQIRKLKTIQMVLFSISIICGQDIITTSSTLINGKIQNHEKNYYSQNFYKTDHSTGGTFLIDYKNECIYEISHSSKTVKKKCIDYYKKLMNQLEQKIINLPLLEKKQLPSKKIKISIQEVGTSTFLSKNCNIYVINNTISTSEIWCDSKLKIPLPNSEFNNINLWLECSNLIEQGYLDYLSPYPIQELINELKLYYSKIDNIGFVLRSKRTDKRFGDIINEVDNVKIEKILDNIFSIPPNYKLIDVHANINVNEQADKILLNILSLPREYSNGSNNNPGGNIIKTTPLFSKCKIETRNINKKNINILYHDNYLLSNNIDINTIVFSPSYNLMLYKDVEIKSYFLCDLQYKRKKKINIDYNNIISKIIWHDENRSINIEIVNSPIGYTFNIN